MNWQLWFRRAAEPAAGDRLYAAIVEQARQPVFYTDLAVPDTVEGRFEMIVLHAALVIDRLMSGDERAREVGQGVFDALFGDMDRNLREMGVGDLRVGQRIKAMAEAFYGRSAAYRQGLAGPGPELSLALGRNLYGLSPPEPEVMERMAEYVRGQAVRIARYQPEDLAAGRFAFDSLPRTGVD